MHSTNYLFLLTQTIFRMWQNAAKGHSSRAGEVDIYRFWLHAKLPRVNFPFQLPTNHLKIVNIYYIK